MCLPFHPRCPRLTLPGPCPVHPAVHPSVPFAHTKLFSAIPNGRYSPCVSCHLTMALLNCGDQPFNIEYHIHFIWLRKMVALLPFHLYLLIFVSPANCCDSAELLHCTRRRCSLFYVCCWLLSNSFYNKYRRSAQFVSTKQKQKKNEQMNVNMYTIRCSVCWVPARKHHN